MRKRTRPTGFTGLALAVGVLALAACSSASSRGSTAGGTPSARSSGAAAVASGGATAAEVAAARAAVAKASAIPTAIPVTVPLPSAPPKGKTVIFMQCEESECTFDRPVPVGGHGLADAVPRLRDQVAAAGRDPAALEIVPFTTSRAGHGRVDAYQQAGATEVCFGIQPADGPLEPALDRLASFVAGRR